MFRGLLVLISVAAVTELCASTGSASSSADRRLDARFGAGTLQMTLTQDGQQVTSLRPGVYRLTVHDNNSHHNFHLIGPNVDDVLTTVAGSNATNGGGDVTVKILLVHGTYKLQCDPHAALGMVPGFDVSGVGKTDATD